MPTVLVLFRRVFLGWSGALLFALPAAAQLDYAEPLKYPGQVVIDSRGLFTLGGSDPVRAERTALVQARLNRILLDQSNPEAQAKGSEVLLGGRLLVTVTADDTRYHNTSAAPLAASWAASLARGLQDRRALATHREFNSAPDWVSFGGTGYSRSDRTRTETTALRSSGLVFKRNLIFVDSDRREPEQVYLRESDGSYAIYDRVTAPRTPPRSN